MERPYTGLTASVKINGSVIGYISGVDLTLDKTIIEILQFGAQYQEKVPAIKNWTGSCDGTAAFAPGGSQHKLYQAYESGELVTLGVFLSDTVYFQGDALISSLNITGAPDDKMSITAEFEGSGGVTFNLPAEYQIQVRSGVGGTTTPGGAFTVAAGGSATITLAPVSGYAIDKVIDNGIDVTASVSNSSYVLTSVAADHVIEVSFKESSTATYKVTVLAGPGGTVSPLGTITVPAGEDVVITATPDGTGTIDAITDNNASQTATSPYTIENIAEDHIVVVTFD